MAEFLNLIQAYGDLPDNGKALRDDCRKSLFKRHELVEKELMQKYPGSTVLSIPGSPTFFAKIQDTRIQGFAASELILKDLDIALNNGDAMGESSEFIRLNLSGASDDFVIFLNRLAGHERYTIKDVMMISIPDDISKGVSNIRQLKN